MAPLTDRQERALQMRREGKKLREIGEALHITPARARALIERAAEIAKACAWAEGLPVRYCHILVARGITTVSGLREAIESGSLRRMPGIGPKCYATIVEWMKQQ